MATHTAADITTLCDAWCKAATTLGGGLLMDENTEKFRLLKNGVIFHELDHEALCAALLGTSRVLLRPRLNTVIDQDHYAVWSWCGELLLSPIAQIFSQQQHEIKSLYKTALNAALAGCRKPPASKEEWQEQNRIQDLHPHHSKQFLSETNLVLAYLAFPLLEAVLKRACSGFVAFDGQVITTFSVPRKQSNTVRTYDPQGRRYSDRQCSSLRDLLFLHHTHVAEPDLKERIDRFRDHVLELDASQDPFDLIYAWRNQSLHGSTNFNTIGGTILNLSLLISIFELKQDFEQHRIKILEHCRWNAQSPYRVPWSFYPPC